MSDKSNPGVFGGLHAQVPIAPPNIAKLQQQLKDAPETGGGPAWDKQKVVEAVDEIAAALKLK